MNFNIFWQEAASTSNVTIAQPPPASTSIPTGAAVSTHPIQGSPSRAPLRPTTGSDPTKVYAGIMLTLSLIRRSHRESVPFSNYSTCESLQ